MTTYLHTSPVEIKKITRTGRFGSVLFFANHEYEMAPSNYTYSLEVEEKDIISVYEMMYQEDQTEILASYIEHLADVLEIDQEEAEELFEHNEFIDADTSWLVQQIQAECAKAMGYLACISEDEQGSVLMIDMLNKESLLNICTK